MVPDFENIRRQYAACEGKFRLFSELLEEFNGKFNLTSITGEEDRLYKHYFDSLAGEFLFPRGARVAEVGSGAGFPSIPLMIVREDLSFSLFESTGKKCGFLRTAIQVLGLHAEVFHMRAEEAGKGEFRESFDVCCARAVARLDTLSEYCLPLVKVGGKMIAYKGEESETEGAARALSLLGGGIPVLCRYDLPEGYGARTLVGIPKVKKTPARYPRGNGAERRSPLS